MQQHAFRTFVAEHDDLPAFRAGFFVMSFLAASLLNFGAFGLLIIAHMSLDIVKYREIHQYDWGVTLRGIVRENILDMAMLVLGLLLSIVLDPSLAAPGMAMVGSSRAMIVRAVSILASKLIVLSRFAIILAHPVDHLNATKIAVRRQWHTGERLFVILFIVLTILLVAAPRVFPLSDALYKQLLWNAVVPWKV